ncbi:MAG: hypothetical protein RLZZ480_759 [Candidatus Parcubacteria bacterium]|jgi:ubiquinone/menaquinone biosynthesis C-methylase UbiE
MDTLLDSTFVVPDIVASHFHLREGDIVADFGTGSGHFLKTLSERVGATGRVYACEIQKQLIEKVSQQVQHLGLKNVYPLWCDLEELSGIKIQTGALDAAILVNTLFQIEDKVAAITEMGRTLRSGGKLFVIDWTDSSGGIGPRKEHVFSALEATALAESNNFILERHFPAGSHHYGLAFRKI